MRVCGKRATLRWEAVSGLWARIILPHVGCQSLGASSGAILSRPISLLKPHEGLNPVFREDAAPRCVTHRKTQEATTEKLSPSS